MHAFIWTPAISAMALSLAGQTLAADVLDNKRTGANLTVNAPITHGLFERKNDSDWYKVKLDRGVTYAVRIDSGAPFNADEPGIIGRLRDSNGQILLSFSDDIDTVGGFSYTAGYTGRHFVEYEHVAGAPLPTGYEASIATDCAFGIKTRCTLRVGSERKGFFNYAQDTDYFKVNLEKHKTYSLFGDGEIGFFAGLRDANNEEIWSDFLRGSTRRFRVPEDGTYFIDTQGEDDFDYKYRLILRGP